MLKSLLSLALYVCSPQEAAEILEKRMAAELMGMPLEDALPITRACGHYLNLTGIAEIHHRRAAVTLLAYTRSSEDHDKGLKGFHRLHDRQRLC